MPVLPKFETGKNFASEVTMAKLLALAEASLVSVSGNLTMRQGPGGTALHVPHPVRMPTRCYAISATSTSLPATINLSSITYDLPATNTTALLGSLSSGAFTFTKEGVFLITFHATAEMDLSGATTATPAPVTVTVTANAGAAALTYTAAKTSAAKTPNFDGFVTNPDGTIEQTVSLNGATGKTGVFGGPIEVPQGVSGDNDANWSVQANVVDYDTGLNVDKTMDVTLDDADIDVTTSLEVITDSEPSGTAFGTVSSTFLVEVIRNGSGDLKINGGAPAVYLDGAVSGGSATITTATLSILQI